MYDAVTLFVYPSSCNMSCLKPLLLVDYMILVVLFLKYLVILCKENQDTVFRPAIHKNYKSSRTLIAPMQKLIQTLKKMTFRQLSCHQD